LHLETLKNNRQTIVEQIKYYEIFVIYMILILVDQSKKLKTPKKMLISDFFITSRNAWFYEFTSIKFLFLATTNIWYVIVNHDYTLCYPFKGQLKRPEEDGNETYYHVCQTKVYMTDRIMVKLNFNNDAPFIWVILHFRIYSCVYRNLTLAFHNPTIVLTRSVTLEHSIGYPHNSS
jgi:hypothetical protein